jgi:dihydrolipoamide dehydrogenase
MPHAVFSEPEVAGVGRTEAQLADAGVAYRKTTARYDSATKGRAIKERHGIVKLLFDDKGAILGCHICGAHASILLHEVIPVMKWRNHVSSLTDIIHIHPSLPELIRGVARKAAKMLG